MYFRMLKRDLKDKIGLNIVLFVFMILATMFTTIGLLMLYTNLYGADLTYRLCNTSDMLILMNQSVNDVSKNRELLEGSLEKIAEYSESSRREVVYLDSSRVRFEVVDNKDSMQLAYQTYVLSGMPEEKNLPYDMEDQPFSVKNGQIAIASHLANMTGTTIGDKVRITTQFGNVYEFEIGTIYKDPSSEMVDQLILSDADRDRLYAECPLKMDFYEVDFDIPSGDYSGWIMDLCAAIMEDMGDIPTIIYGSKNLFLVDDGVINLLVSMVMVIVAVFLLGLIFITINFSLKSTIKREEREIGMMKAIGVYSLSYKTLFAVKYFVFAILGGIIGLPLALVLGKMFINRFSFHIIYPAKSAQIMIAVISVCMCILFIIGFILLSLRRMNRISVMDAIHGENRGERFKKLPGFALHKSGRMHIELFLALSDILKRIKRYIYLILAFVCGIGVIILVIQVRDTLCSDEYMKTYWQKGEIDFAMVVEDKYLDKLVSKTGNVSDAYDLIYQNIYDHGIPAKISHVKTALVDVYYHDEKVMYCMCSGDYDSSDLVVTKGHVPVLANEVAVPSYNAKQDGLKIGDTITIEYDKYEDNHISYSKVKEEFLITGFFEGMGLNVPYLYVGPEFTGAQTQDIEYFSRELLCSDEEYDYYFEKMDDLYTDDEVRFFHKDNVLDYFMGSWVSMFNLMLIVVSVVISLVLILLTVLYQNIFLEEEVSDIALLKSMGFDDGFIKKWHYLRMIILVIVSIIMANILMNTLGALLVSEIAKSILKVEVFRTIVRLTSNFLIIPVAVFIVVTISVLPALSPVKYIQIWRIKSE